jgi:hypothetical protein
MWAQMQRVRTHPDRGAELQRVFEQLRAIEQKARAREADPRRQELLQRVRGALGEVLTGPPEVMDLKPAKELLHIQSWLARVDDIVRRGGLADDEAGRGR